MSAQLIQLPRHPAGDAALRVAGPVAEQLGELDAVEIRILQAGQVERYLDPRNVNDPWATTVFAFRPAAVHREGNAVVLELEYGVTYHLRANQPYRLVLRRPDGHEFEERFTGSASMRRPSAPPSGWTPPQRPSGALPVPAPITAATPAGSARTSVAHPAAAATPAPDTAARPTSGSEGGSAKSRLALALALVMLLALVSSGVFFVLRRDAGSSAPSAASSGSPPRVFRDCPDCPELVMLARARFVIGSPDSEPDREPDEGPRRTVQFAGDFAIGRHEVTRGQYARFARETGRPAETGCYSWDGQRFAQRARAGWSDPGFAQTDNDPVVCVSWDDAAAYARWLSGVTGKRYRLPSEAEWEYAARARTEGRRYWGEADADSCRHANVADASARAAFRLGASFDCSDGHAATAPVGSYPPNAFGLHDMLGNALEWAADCWSASYEALAADGAPSVTGDCRQRVLRGGSWYNDPRRYLRAADRIRAPAGLRLADTGFRVVRLP